ncbi:hypothetical protein PF007_g29565 [Phytophthora fragariae]|uniref:Uncharacterized protein n=1 Tax=Phytophthora fragariae TaxID=53985 RepID=A0A6A3PXG4_9STRA|nr:hypothetical protein PF007_g29565 [Phytophthora fragariae]
MKVGSKNEDNISSRLPVWFREQTQYDLKHTKSYGLLCRPDMKYLAFSPGGVGMFSSPETQDFFAILEYKTRTTPVTIAKEAAIATKYDKFVTITLNSAEDGDDFKTIVPDQSHRSQLLHNTIGASLTNGMLVYASPTSIIRVVHVILSDDVIDAYLLAISGVKDLCLDWIYTSNAPVPSLSTDELGFCGDLEILKQHLSLWRELCKIVDARGKPLPAAKHIIPTLIATWNRVKGGIDVYSRFLKNVRARHQHLPPLAAIWIRILMTIVYNAFQSTQLLQTYSFLMFDERCDSYSALQQFKSDNLKLVDFFRDAALAMPDLITRQEEPNPNADIEPSILSNAVTTMAISTAYNKLDRFNNDPEFRRLRLSKRHCHHAERFDAGKQLCCILCCQLNHDSENLPHTRKGYKTRFYCSICDVALCQTPRWSDNQSCFERFHALTKVPKACQPSTEQMQQPKHIRAPPPTRKRSRESVEPNERRVTRLVAKARRQSARLMARGA